MITQMYTRIELRFWDWAIPVLSQSPRVHKMLRWFSPLADEAFTRSLLKRSLILSVVGFVGGVLANLLILK
jgi:hypothetical protein